MVVSFKCQFTEIYSPFLKLSGCSYDASVSSDPVRFENKQGRGVLFSFSELGTGPGPSLRAEKLSHLHVTHFPSALLPPMAPFSLGS